MELLYLPKKRWWNCNLVMGNDEELLEGGAWNLTPGVLVEEMIWLHGACGKRPYCELGLEKFEQFGITIDTNGDNPCIVNANGLA